jgi:ferredoxin--NADP+ reductase
MSDTIEQTKTTRPKAKANGDSQYNATVIAREEVNSALLIVRVKPDEELFDFEAGQFGVLGLLGSAARVPQSDAEGDGEKAPNPNKLIRRAYSIASSSVQREYAEFFITLVPSGELTPRLFHLQVGDRLFLSKKASGLFTLDHVPADKHVVMVGTGTGLAPYMSMLRTHLLCGGNRQFVVLHGARYSWDLGYRAELETLSHMCSNFTYIPSITRPAQDPYFGGKVGRIQALIEAGVLEECSPVIWDPKYVDVFLCGNPGMIEAGTEWLEKRGFVADAGKTVGTIHTEKYW